MPVKPKALHPALAARATAVKAAHALLSKTVSGFRRQSPREQFRQTQAHLRRTSPR